MKRVLLTAFEPFGGETVNPSSETVPAVAIREIENVELMTLELPLDQSEAVSILLEEDKRLSSG